MAVFTCGNFLMLIVAIFTSVGCYIADWNQTHIYNPTWTGHAKFHNAQTMTMGLLLGILTAYFQLRSTNLLDNYLDSHENEKKSGETLRIEFNALAKMRLIDINIAAILGSLYWITQATSILYPGTTLADPPADPNKGPQPVIDLALISVILIAWNRERSLVTKLVK